MVARANNVLAAWEAQLYVDGIPYINRVTRIERRQTEQAIATSTCASKVGTARPVLTEDMIDFTRFDKSGAIEDISAFASAEREDTIIPVLFAQSGGVVIGAQVNVVDIFGARKSTTLGAGSAIETTWSCRTGDSDVEGVLTAFPSQATANQNIFEGVSAAWTTTTIPGADTDTNSTTLNLTNLPQPRGALLVRVRAITVTGGTPGDTLTDQGVTIRPYEQSGGNAVAIAPAAELTEADTNIIWTFGNSTAQPRNIIFKIAKTSAATIGVEWSGAYIRTL